MASKYAACVNCGRQRWIKARDRCKGCYLYLLHTDQERPCPPPERKKYQPPAMCDCGRAPATKVLVVKNGRTGHKVRIRVCEQCWELEKG